MLLKHGGRRSLERAMFLAIVLAVFAFSVATITTTAATNPMPGIDRLESSAKGIQPLGDPIDGGPPGAWSIRRDGN